MFVDNGGSNSPTCMIFFQNFKKFSLNFHGQKFNDKAMRMRSIRGEKEVVE